jgi:hypothetical protein
MESIERLRQISRKEFMHYGMQDLAYIKPTVVDGVPSYAVHAADGTPIAVIAERELAFATIRQYDMEPLSVH